MIIGIVRVIVNTEYKDVDRDNFHASWTRVRKFMQRHSTQLSRMSKIIGWLKYSIDIFTLRKTVFESKMSRDE